MNELYYFIIVLYFYIFYLKINYNEKFFFMIIGSIIFGIKL